MKTEDNVAMLFCRALGAATEHSLLCSSQADPPQSIVVFRHFISDLQKRNRGRFLLHLVGARLDTFVHNYLNLLVCCMYFVYFDVNWKGDERRYMRNKVQTSTLKSCKDFISSQKWFKV